MQLVSRKNFLLALAAILVVAMGYMALTLSKQNKKSEPSTFEREIRQVETQSRSDEVEDIDKDLSETELNDLDKELQNIDAELNATY
ncbi:hypothetical protein A2715_01405 [Candidatus Woesebacteria bacterium RIFCSPHIGHO2_01_FULL_39_32]|uniref:Uncharacterized protein n=1 Tax=Candidatus Woesebacteria bacterium RIFCSPLOWO2_01_FULL_39_25 TaxID=1802521 RepID=A0A1F8BJT2_9BACT|nr:MAG: hypothetical protein A2124_03810 [Candidatus Woesebacteria bacterium GWB1_37_5]OGM24138.1 MAG: hypothetical protein A2715_01405 [Candidatus Woesebacteria bacterium RIFCSPHIGHO2_01_FULL_39_32]OGM38114.1 MAG: hypothetical protein A3F01_02175 [Candidatus Woesebacteria bacterium RIFCSPHIGHO2_12_FULL_38_11]OGM64220.1 MAG: hypothetical protein A2893_06670 [Candidatus Woesebacteria bacterium RIFCSPLOWO2_01_FULL_39_25]